MKRRRVFNGAGLILVISAAILPLASSAGAQSVCCNDVKFPGSYGGPGGGESLAIVDGVGHGRNTYRTIQGALDDVARDGQVQIKPAPGGVYDLDRPLHISRPVTISSFDDGGTVRIHAQGRCVTVSLRRPGRVAIKGVSFESDGNDDGCVVVENAGEFALKGSEITVTKDALPTADRCVPIVAGKRRPAGLPSCGFSGVVILSGVAKIEGNGIRRTGTAIALLSPGSDEHKIVGNYIAGNAVGVYADNGARFRIERNGIFRNHNIGVDLAEASGTVQDNDIEDNWTGLKVVPPSAFGSGADPGYRRGAARDPQIFILGNLVTQYGVYRPNGYDVYHDNGSDRLKDAKLTPEEKARYGFALDFALDPDYVDDNVYDYPKRGSVLSGMEITGNCFFGPATSWFDRDRFMPLIAPNPPKESSSHPKDGDKAPYWYLADDEAAYRNNSHSSGYKDAVTPLWFFDANTWAEHLDYEGVDKIDHDNAIRSPRYDGSFWPFNRSMWTAVHNWFARNKKEMTCGGRAVVGGPGDWPRFDTGPMH